MIPPKIPLDIVDFGTIPGDMPIPFRFNYFEVPPIIQIFHPAYSGTYGYSANVLTFFITFIVVLALEFFIFFYFFHNVYPSRKAIINDAIVNNSISTAILLLLYNAFFIIAYSFFKNRDFSDLGILGFTRYLRNEVIAYLVFFVLAFAIEYGIFSILLKRRSLNIKASKIFKAVFLANLLSFGIMYIWVYFTLSL